MATKGQKIKTWRTLKGITQEELAAKFNGARSTVSRIENGTLEPNGQVLAALASLGMNIEELLGTDEGYTKEKALQLRVTELELKLMQIESRLEGILDLIEKKL